MTAGQFNELLELVKNALTKRSIRKPLSPQFRLAVTVCYLAAGTSPIQLAHYWMIGTSTAYSIINETSEAIWNALKTSHLPPPSQDNWREIADGYEARWNLPYCCGALDGKHIRIQCPFQSGSQFYNYKNFFSLVLMATCDSKYCFTTVEVGDYGSLPDSSVFRSCLLGKAMEEGTLQFPDPAPLPNTNTIMPFFLIGDEAFPLRTDLLRPYPQRNLPEIQRVFNYRLSRARLTIENSFGILSTRWGILGTTLAQHPKNVERIVLATVCLHNFIMKREEHTSKFKQYCPPGYADGINENGEVVPGQWRREAVVNPNIQDIGQCGGNRPAGEAVRMRDTLARYFVSDEGFVEWQWRRALRGFEVQIPESL